MPISKTNLNFYLTSVEPAIAQSNTAQSVGAYISTTELYPNTTLSSNLGLYDTALTLAKSTDLNNLSYLGINSEIIKTETISQNAVTATTRGLNNSSFFHASSDIVYGLSIDRLFDQKYNDDLKQYRCIALKNEDASNTAVDTVIYLKQNVVNLSSTIKIAVEAPRSDYLSSTATGGSQMTVIDSSIAGIHDDNHFSGSYLRITSGTNTSQARIVASYDKDSGTFVLESSLPFNVASDDGYEVEPSPAQRIKSGLISPSFDTARVGSLGTPKGIVGLQNDDRANIFTATDANGSISININSDRDHGSDLRTNDVIYIWLEKSLAKDSSNFSANSVILTVNYFT